MSADTDNPSRDIYSVTRLNREVRAVLEGSFPPLWVQGEVSNLARPASGHLYFSLKDAHSQVRCAMFKGRNRHLKFSLENGMQVITRAQVGLYEGRGEFQLIVEAVEPAGAGALQQAFEQLKARLEREGLFRAEDKRPLPAFPAAIGVVTSPSGAAIRDILQVLGRRYPGARVIIYPTAVQGEGAGRAIAAALEKAGSRAETQVLILARGGGSLEDLWAFNEEVVARAVRACPIPVVSGVGHEIDFTIADFAADRRAPTPSAAAETVSPDSLELGERLAGLQNKLVLQMHYRIRKSRETLTHYQKRLPHPSRVLQNLAQRLDGLQLRLSQSFRTIAAVKRSRLLQVQGQLARHNPVQGLRHQRHLVDGYRERIGRAMSYNLERLQARLNTTARTLNAVSPLLTLERGYAIVTHGEEDRVLRQANAVEPGEEIRVRLASGRLHSTVKKVIDDE